MPWTITRRVWVVTLTLTFVSAIASAQVTKNSADTSGVGRQVRAAQDQLLEAAQQGDKAQVSKLVADDVAWVGMNGDVQSKAQMLASLPAQVRSVDVQQVLPMGTTAVLVALVHLKDGTDRRAVQEWANRDGKWELTAHESAPIGTASPAGTAGTSGAMGKGVAREAVGASVAPTLRTSDERAVWKACESLQQAFLKGDRATYSKYTADNFVRVSPASVEGKKQFLQNVEKNRNESPGRLTTREVRISVNGDTARVLAETSGQLPGGTEAGPMRTMRIFERQDGRWQQVAAIFTPLAQQ